MSSDSIRLDGCGCCEGLPEPVPVRNDAGLPALRYRLDTQAGFYARMLASLPLARTDPETADAPRPLERLLSREGDDPSIALLDSAACVADVLCFYQERIANEGFLRTAAERRSVLELARAVGYELKPGVAASVHLAFTVEDAPGAPGVCTLAEGTPVQSVPTQGMLPQVFETSAEIVAYAQWNALRPRQVRPADLAVIEVAASGEAPARKALMLLAPEGSFPDGTTGLQRGLSSLDLYRLDPGVPVSATVDALEVGRVFFSEAASGINGGDLLLFVGKRGKGLRTLILRATSVVPEPALRRIRVDVEPLPEPVSDSIPDPPPAPRATWVVPYTIKPALGLARPQVKAVPFSGTAIAAAVTSKVWREGDLQAMIGMQRWSAPGLEEAIAATPPSGPPVAAEAGAFGFATRVGFFGNNAPKWLSILPPHSPPPYAEGWDSGDTGVPPGSSRTVWEDSQGTATAPSVYLERGVANVPPRSWVLFDAPDVAAQAFTVRDARETSRADFGLSGRALRLRVADAQGAPLATDLPPFRFRDSTAHVASRRLDLAELPIEAPIAAGDTQIELDRMVLGLSVGQLVALVGERADLPGVKAAEIALLADILHAEGRTTLKLRKGLVHSYVRTGLTINANVVHATHGESVTEILGNGDASIPHQRFVLKKPPLTYLSAPGGMTSTLEVRVAGVLWDQAPSLYGAASDQPVYAVRRADDGTTELSFGDGVQGARLPSGTLNIAARYRSGIGPDGEVGAGALTMLRAMPLGLRGVTNPVAAGGAEGPETLADARRNAPLTLLTFERVVSLLDYEDYARGFPGIGKARADRLWVDGSSRILLTVAGATGGAPGSEVIANLRESLAAAGDGSQPFNVRPYLPRYFGLAAKVAVDPRDVASDVRSTVAQTLLDGFSFEARGLAQSVTAAELVTLIHGVPGVVAVDLDALFPYGDETHAAEPAETALPAFSARWEASSALLRPAELLLINPAGLVIEEMPA